MISDTLEITGNAKDWAKEDLTGLVAFLFLTAFTVACISWAFWHWRCKGQWYDKY